MKYLVIANYNADGIKGVLAKGGTARKDAVAKLVAGLGGSLESFHFAFGSSDVYAIADVPDNVTAAAVALTVNASGAVHTKMTVLLTPEEVDAAAEKSISYTPPGG